MQKFSKNKSFETDFNLAKKKRRILQIAIQGDSVWQIDSWIEKKLFSYRHKLVTELFRRGLAD